MQARSGQMERSPEQLEPEGTEGGLSSRGGSPSVVLGGKRGRGRPRAEWPSESPEKRAEYRKVWRANRREKRNLRTQEGRIEFLVKLAEDSEADPKARLLAVERLQRWHESARLQLPKEFDFSRKTAEEMKALCFEALDRLRVIGVRLRVDKPGQAVDAEQVGDEC